MPLKELYETSPFGVVSAFFYGTIQSALFTLLAVYAASMNFTIFQISLVTFLLADFWCYFTIPYWKTF